MDSITYPLLEAYAGVVYKRQQSSLYWVKAARTVVVVEDIRPVPGTRKNTKSTRSIHLLVVRSIDDRATSVK
jgi:hypothetical protein